MLDVKGFIPYLVTIVCPFECSTGESSLKKKKKRKLLFKTKNNNKTSAQ